MSGHTGFRRGWRVVASALVIAATACASPARADTFTVNLPDDASDDAPAGICKATGFDGCTLRAAIEEANDEVANPGFDEIRFSPALLGSNPLLEIDAGLGALEISAPASLEGCNGAIGPPCVTVRGEAPGGMIDIFRVTGDGVTIRGFAIGNGASGVFIDGATGTLISGNSIGLATSNGWAGLDLANSGPGIRIRDDASDGEGAGFEGNVIGGDTAESENVIANNAGPAIAVEPSFGGALGDPASDLNTIGRNRGSGNGNLFIDLGVDGFGNPSAQNDGVLAPEIALAGPSFIRGTGAPNATVLVFRTFGAAGTSPSSVSAFLGRTTVTAGGSWRLDAANSLGAGTRITALQTAAANSSELAPAAAVDVRPPALSITAGPSGPTNNTTPSFRFVTEPGAATSCGFAAVLALGPCDSDFTFTAPAPLPDGDHVFQLQAVDAAGNTSLTQREFSVDTFIRTAIRRAPGERRVFRRVTYKFRAEEAGEEEDEHRFVEEPGASFVCRLDARRFKPCSSPQRYRGLDLGRHVFRVAATDDVGNVDDTPAKDSFMIVRPRRK